MNRSIKLLFINLHAIDLCILGILPDKFGNVSSNKVRQLIHAKTIKPGRAL